MRFLRTVIVTADIDGGFGQLAMESKLSNTAVVNLPASVRCQPLYIHLRVSRDLCFW